MGFVKDFVAGGFAGVAQITVGMPFDTVKVLMQAQQQQVARGELGVAQQQGATSIARGIIAKEGAKGLYKGMATPLAGIAFVNMVLFSVNNLALKGMGYSAAERGNATIPALVAAGGFSGGVSAVVMGPTELIKTRLQVPGASKATSPIDVIKEITRESGLRGLFRGVGPTIGREAVGNAGFFAGYAVAKQQMARHLGVPVSEIPTHLVPLCGISGGLTCWLLAYPIDVIKTRAQLAVRAESSVAAARKVFANEGVAGFYKGITPALVRCVPVSASIFTTFHVVEGALNKHWPEEELS